MCTLCKLIISPMNYYLSRFQFCIVSIAIYSFLALNLTSCSIFSEKYSAESLKLELILPESWPASWKISQIDDEPYLYKILIKDPELKNEAQKYSPTYALSLQECGVGKNASAGATTRQLLVGLKDIHIIRKETFNYNDQRIFYKESTAKLDEHDIKLISYTLREKNCVKDSIIWSDDMQSGSVIDWFSSANVESLKRIYFAFSYRASK